MLFFASPENILLTMLTDDRIDVRNLDIRKILKAKKNVEEAGVRTFAIPTINFGAAEYVDLID